MSVKKMDGVIVVIAGLLIQLLWAWQITLPTYMDGYYYTTNGARLANGFGFTEEIIWQYLDEPTTLPTPSHSYWMPVPSLLAAGGYLITASFRGAQFPFWLLSGFLPLLSWMIARTLGLMRWQALAAALFTASGGFYAGWLNQPATFAPFAWFGGLCLLLQSQGMFTQRRKGWYWGLAGVLAGFAHLTRADGVLLLLSGLLLLFWMGWRERHTANWRLAGLFVVGYTAVMGGWMIRNWLIWQRPLSVAGTQTIFLTSYDDLFAYGRTFDFNHLLSWGLENMIQSRLDGLWIGFQTFLAVNGFIFLFPFIVWGWHHLYKKQSKQMLPLTLYTIILYGTMTLIFTFPGQRGGLFHSSIGIWPWCMVLAPVGIERAVLFVARRLPHWKPERASILFTALFVIGAFVLTAVITISRQGEDVETAVYEAFAAQMSPDAVVMVGNPPKFNYHTSHPAISVPNEPIDQTYRVAAKYGATYLVLDSNLPQPLLSLYLNPTTQPEVELIQQIDQFQLYRFNDELP